MSKETLWYGYIEAGEKSSPVVMDPRLQTGEAETVYLYNHKRGSILEYRRAIVDAKLRELSAEEHPTLASELRSAYRKARQGFTPRAARVAQILEKSRAAPRKTPAVEAEIDTDGLDDLSDAFLDSDEPDDDRDEDESAVA